MKLTKIKTELTAEQVENWSNSLTKEEAQYVENLGIASFDVVENGLVSMYIFHDGKDIYSILDFLCNNSVKHTTEDLTEKALFGQANVEDHNFNCELKRWSEQNISIDTVLDKISKYGKDSLNETDQKVLENY